MEGQLVGWVFEGIEEHVRMVLVGVVYPGIVREGSTMFFVVNEILWQGPHIPCKSPWGNTEAKCVIGFGSLMSR
jgi:hypothetical protein